MRCGTKCSEKHGFRNNSAFHLFPVEHKSCIFLQCYTAWRGLELESPIVSSCPWWVRPWAQAASPVPHHSRGDGGERSEYVLPVSIESNPGVNHSRERRPKLQTQLYSIEWLQKPGSYWTKLKYLGSKRSHRANISHRKFAGMFFPWESNSDSKQLGGCFTFCPVVPWWCWRL